MIKYILTIILAFTSSLNCKSQVVFTDIQLFGIEFNYVAVELTNCIYPIIRSTNLIDWEQCGLLVPIPSNPRAAICYYRVGADWNTNFPLWITRTNTVHIYHTNILLQFPKTVYVTQDVVYHKLPNKTTTSAKVNKLNTPLVNYKSLPLLPQQ